MSRLALVFPGQGSQAVGMMRPFAETAIVREVFSDASRALGEDLWRLVAEGPDEALNATINTQPVMLTAGYAVYRAWCEAGGRSPAVTAGHSLGEYTALVAAGVITFAAAVPLVRKRAQAMQESVPPGTGAMAAILGLEEHAVRAVCNEAAQGGIVEAVNFNAPNQIVIAGHKAAVERAAAMARERGAKRVVILPLSAPFHSSLLRPAAERLERWLEEVAFSPPATPVINNVDVATPAEPLAIKRALARQAASPVRWVETMRHMAESGVTDIVECGPGRVLAGLARRTVPTVRAYAITDPNELARVLEAVG
jgi:[acyl-carrier-protein] S-malonyltransferase